ncbi:MAG TPA: ribulose-phosphate 3-epimerase [Solirubrobacteraceae bacterium]|jgi:ribulose-phosphate 3-epimerase|nr:ribulose-phosphate 3-epimerase [Solirubrobacteraceae bacterium]
MAVSGAETRAVIGGVHVVPSILSADFARLGEQVQQVLDAGAREIQVDVMDGHFVPPITVGALVVEALREQMAAAGAVIDVHLMVERPERQIDAFAAAGADHITVHFEATPHVLYALEQVHSHGCTAGLALCPATPVSAVEDVLDEADMLLCMTVNPGWGGQAFIEHSIPRLRRLRALAGPEKPIQVDGGIDPATGARCRAAGATLFVAGSAVFGAPDPGVAFRAIADAVGESCA